METFETYDLRQLDPNRGVLATITHWRPRVKDPDPDHPGEKATASVIYRRRPRQVALAEVVVRLLTVVNPCPTGAPSVPIPICKDIVCCTHRVLVLPLLIRRRCMPFCKPMSGSIV